MATQQRSSRKTTEQVETGAETALAKGTGGRGLGVEGAKSEVKGRGEAFSSTAVVNGDNGFVGLSEKEFASLGLSEKEVTELALTEKELAKLRPASLVTSIGGAYCPNPQIDELIRGYETLVKATIQHPEMRKIEKTDVVKEIHYENKTVRVPKTIIKTERVQHNDQIVVVRKVAKTRPKTFYRVVEEVREVTEMVDVVEYIDVPWFEEVPRFTTEYIDEIVPVPVVKEERVKRTVEEPTGKFCKYSLDHLNIIEPRDLAHDFKSDDDDDILKKDDDILKKDAGPRLLSLRA